MATNIKICSKESEFELVFDRWGKRFNFHDVPEREFFKNICKYNNFYPMTQSKFQARQLVISQIYRTNSNNMNIDTIYKLVEEYYITKSSIRRMDIRYGIGCGKQFSNKLKKSREKSIRPHVIEYWINKGNTQTDAAKKRDQYNSNSGIRRRSAQLKKLEANINYKQEIYAKISNTKRERRQLAYWIKNGVTEDRAKEKLLKYVPPINSLDRYIAVYGDKEGLYRFNNSNNKRKNTLISRYGTYITSCYTSKQSLRYFIPLYKMLRKSGISRADIRWGCGKNREFTTCDPKTKLNYAYDFVILSKKIIIEYNHIFWHPRLDLEWNNRFVDCDIAAKKDIAKKQLAESLGFTVIYVWSDNLTPIEQLKNKIL